MRIVIFSSAPVPKLHHLLRRLAADLPEVVVAGVVCERPRQRLSAWRRVERFCRLLPDRDFRRYCAHQIAAGVGALATRAGDRLLRWVHACPADPNGRPVTLDSLASECAAAGVAFAVTDDIHDEPTLSFVRGARPDLGVVFGTRVLKPELFSIPARGSIDVHQHKVPEYQGPGPPGLWELRDGKTEAAVTVHRVRKEADAGDVLGERRLAIDPLDTLESIGLKADLLGIDLLIDVLRAESRGGAAETPQGPAGTVCDGCQPHRLFAVARAVRASRPAHRVRRGRPAFKLFLKSLSYPLLIFRNMLRRRRKSFPVVILMHHLVTDKPHHLGVSTDRFARHVRYLKKHYRVASLPEAVEILRRGECPTPTVVLTFDDGYADNFLGLRAVAESEGLPVAHFITTRNASDGAAFGHDLDRRQTGFPPLSWDQVRYLDRHGATIGSHTRSHFDCGSEDEGRLVEEIAGSREDLARELGHEVPFFAFPKGKAWNRSAAALAVCRRTFPFFLSADGGENRGPMHPPCELKRCAHPASLWELELLLQSVLNFRRERAPEGGRARASPVVRPSSHAARRAQGDRAPSRT
jgi:peptidoglycan/xylan/chitin deacetylase (PgdA/CDA1 family)